jgi:hypothetical protein
LYVRFVRILFPNSGFWCQALRDDSKINDIAKEQPEHPAHPHSDNFKFADDDGSAHPGRATSKDKDISVQPSAEPKIGDIPKERPEHPAHPHSDVNQLAGFKFADEGSDSGHLAHPHFDNAKVPGTVMSDAASDQFVFEKGHAKVADVKPDIIESDHAVADIRYLLHTAHDANAVGALDPNHTIAPQDMTKVQLPHQNDEGTTEPRHVSPRRREEACRNSQIPQDIAGKTREAPRRRRRYDPELRARTQRAEHNAPI